LIEVNMKFSTLALLGVAASASALPNLKKRDAQFTQGQPISADGKGGPILGMFHDCAVRWEMF
jgi:hypothetical protein